MAKLADPMIILDHVIFKSIDYHYDAYSLNKLLQVTENFLYQINAVLLY